MKVIPFKVLFGLLAFLFFLAASAQDIDNLSSVDIDDLSDSQIEAYINRAQESGLTLDQLELLARQRGMSAAQLAKLRQRILKIQTGTSSGKEGLEVNENRLRSNFEEEDRIAVFDDLIGYDSLETDQLPIFGADIFEASINFEPSINTATPENYLLGPGDEVIIDVYGASEISYRKVISPDGKILISGVGPIHLSGISVKSARARMLSRLSAIYSGLRGARPNTYMDLSVGQIRTINVNVVGNVKRPGTYPVSSFSTAFDALFLAGGPNEYGSMRKIDVMRGGEKISTLDVYKYFFFGEMSGNPQLQDGDVLLVKTYQNRVVYAGEVKQQAIYEFLAEESFSDLLEVSGGAMATGYDERVTVFRSGLLNRSLKSFDVSEAINIPLLDGDSIFIPKISSNYVNRVKIEGAVEQPGFYELDSASTLSSLINTVNVSKDAYLKRGNIIRLNDDLTLSNISFDLAEVLNGTSDYTLMNEDLIKIPSILDIEARKTVTILGEIKNDGEYPYISGMTVEDLIAISGGLKVSANSNSIEVARRVSKDSKEFRTAVIFDYSIAEDLGLDSASTFELLPFDLVTVKASALFRTQKTVKVEGEVLKPGYYALETEEDRLTDLINRAGGVTTYAYPKGASLIRDLNPNASKDEDERDLETTSTDEGDFYRRQQLEGLIKRDSLEEINSAFARKEGVGIQLDRALEEPNSKYNLILQDGDVISIPKQLQTVRVRGEVLYPTRVNFDKSDSFRDYISLAGGFSDDAQVKKSYIVYANGRAKRTKKILFFKVFPPVEPGADIFIPERPERRKLSSGEVLGITSGLASLSLVIIQIINITN